MPIYEARVDEHGLRWAEFPNMTSSNVLTFESDDVREYFTVNADMAKRYEDRRAALRKIKPQEVYAVYAEAEGPLRLIINPIESWSADELFKMNQFY